MGLFTPNTKTITNFFDKGVFLLAWRISMAFFLVFLILTFIYGFSSNSQAAIPASMVLIVSSFCLFYLKRTKNYRILFWIYAIAGTLLANFAMNYVLDYTHYVDFIWIIACVLISYVGLGWKYGIMFMGINAVGIAYFFWFTLNDHITTLQPKNNLEILGDYIEMIFALTVIAFLMKQFVFFQKYSASKLKSANIHLESQNQLILSKNKENETLMKEIHHRVKNNLQIIISLLRMQSAELKNVESKTQFSEAISRIMAMSLIHEKLYGEKELSKINLKSYLHELSEEIIALSVDNKQIDLAVDTNISGINLDFIVPLGLLVNELVSNSLKHAFSNKNTGQIQIRFTLCDTDYKLTYEDNGTWKEPDENRTSFGFELIDILTEQMNGQKTIDTSNGTKYEFQLQDPTKN